MRKIRDNVLRWVGLLIFVASFVQAAPFDKTIQFQQPDGTGIELWGKGDEFYAVFETLDGYTVTFDPALKTYFYATVSADGTQLVATDLQVGGQGNPQARGLAQHVRISAEAAHQQALARFAKWDLGTENTKAWNARKSALHLAEKQLKDGPLMAPPSFTTTGHKQGLCLLIDFDNDPATIPQAQIVNFCNGDNFAGFGNNGSVKKYFLDNSNNLLMYSNTVTAYIRIPNTLHPKSYYNDTSKDCGSQANLLIRDALAIMKSLPNYESEILPSFDDLTVDGAGYIQACSVFYAGGNGGVWTYGLWPHSWSLYEVGAQELTPGGGGKKVFKYQVTNIGGSLALGTFCHENGHMLCGYPDIYDYQYDSVGGAGNFCLMDYGGPDNNPVQICAYLKYASGWATTVEAAFDSSINAVSVATLGVEGFNRFYRYAKPGTPTEYYLFENRQKIGRDASLPAEGIAIWHIDELGNRDNQSTDYNATHQNYECTLVQADNLWHFQKNINAGDANDLYYSGNTAPAYTGLFSDFSTPSARWWDGTPSLLEASAFSISGPTMTFSIVPRPPVMVTTGALPDGWVGTPYSYVLMAVRGATPYTWSLVSGVLPSGLGLSSSGEISGVPGTATTASFDVAVTGANGVATTNLFSLIIHPASTIPFSEPFENGGPVPPGWSQEYVTNAVPWTFRSGGPLGHPLTAHGGNSNACLTVTATNRVVTRLVSPMIDFGVAPQAAQLTFWHYMEAYVGDQDHLRIYYKTAAGSPWILIPQAVYMTSINQWRKQTVTLPNPGRSYYIAFEGTARYGYGIYIDDVYVSDPTPPLSITTTSPLPDAIINVPYTQQLAAVSGSLPYTFALASGALPQGMTLGADGVISGSTSNTMTANFVVSVTDGVGGFATSAFTLAVTRPVTVMFSENFDTYGGQLPTDWTQEYVAGTDIASWRCQSGGGDIRNFHQPTNAHSGAFNALLFTSPFNTDHKTKLVTKVINLGGVSSGIRLTFWHCMTALSPDQDELRVYYKTSAGGSWNLISAYTQDVPAWTKRTLVLPNPSSTYYLAFEGNAKFGNGVCIDDVLISDEASAPTIMTPSPLPNGLVGAPYQQAMTALGGAEPYAWLVVSNTLPSGLNLSASGVISGTPDNAGTTVFRVQVTGADGYAASSLFSLRINLVRGLPFNEPFENGGQIPLGWTQEYVLYNLSWTFGAGSPMKPGYPSAAHGGSYNARLYNEISAGHRKTKLVSPMIDLGTSTTNTQLSFWFCMAEYLGDQDELRVFCRSSAGAAWTQLAEFKKSQQNWTNIVVSLPNPSSTYFIAFEGVANYGYGVCVDDVSITGSQSPYPTWKSIQFTESQIIAGGIAGDNDDPDGDGIVNALEYAMGLDPWVFNTTGCPVGGVSSNYLTYAYRKNMAATDVRYEVVACTSLVASVWSTNGVSSLPPAMGSNTWWSVMSWHTVPVTNAPKRFMRLRVYLP